MTLIGLVLSPVLYASFFDRLYIDIWSGNPVAELNIMSANCALALLTSYSDEHTENARVYQANARHIRKIFFKVKFYRMTLRGQFDIPHYHLHL